MVRASLQGFAEGLVSQYQSLYLAGLGASGSILGFIGGLRGVAAVATSLFSGHAIDRYGLRLVFSVATALMLCGSILYALAPGWVYAVPAALVFFLGLTMSITACPVVCGSVLRPWERATGRGICDTLTAIPRMAAPYVGAFLVSLFGGLTVDGIRCLFYVQALVLAATLILVVAWFEEPAARRSRSVRAGIVSGVRSVLREGRFVGRWIVFDSLTKIPHYAISSIYVPLYAAKVKGADQYTLGAMASASMLTPILLSIPFGRLADRIGRKKVIAAAIAAYTASLLVLVEAKTTTELVLSGALQGFTEVAAIPRGAMAADLVPVHLLGSLHGLLGVARGVASIATPLVAGAIWDTLGPSKVFLFTATTQLAAIALLASIPEKPPEEKGNT